MDDSGLGAIKFLDAIIESRRRLGSMCVQARERPEIIAAVSEIDLEQPGVIVTLIKGAAVSPNKEQARCLSIRATVEHQNGNTMFWWLHLQWRTESFWQIFFDVRATNPGHSGSLSMISKPRLDSNQYSAATLEDCLKIIDKATTSLLEHAHVMDLLGEFEMPAKRDFPF